MDPEPIPRNPGNKTGIHTDRKPIHHMAFFPSHVAATQFYSTLQFETDTVTCSTMKTRVNVCINMQVISSAKNMMIQSKMCLLMA